MSALSVQGASSSAGKSVLTTALARAFSRRGVDVVPFKAQNMSNNARVVAGGEIGVAQYLQALAARVEPEVRMNPVLIKPEGDNRSQVVILGKPDLALSRQPWRARRGALWPVIESALSELLAEHEFVLLEGAGSPAEINLRDTDLANMRSAKSADAPVVLVADIDRGGAFAHLYGTWSLLQPDERARVAGFVLNKFRGDAALLDPAPRQLQDLTGVPLLGVIPWLDHGLPDEDGAAAPTRLPSRPTVAVVRYPTASNLDEFKLLEQAADVRWAASPHELEGAELVVLPGSKHVASDLTWLRRSGVADAIVARARRGGRVLGICGGLQMLGRRIDDDAGVDGTAEGLGLLPVATTFRAAKTTRHVDVRFAELSEPWAPLGGQELRGYEIRHGETVPAAAAVEAVGGGLGFVSGAVLGVSVHGVLEAPAIVAALTGVRPGRSLDDVFDGLADAVETHLDVGRLLDLAAAA